LINDAALGYCSVVHHPRSTFRAIPLRWLRWAD